MDTAEVYSRFAEIVTIEEQRAWFITQVTSTLAEYEPDGTKVFPIRPDARKDWML